MFHFQRVHQALSVRGVQCRESCELLGSCTEFLRQHTEYEAMEEDSGAVLYNAR